MLLLPILLLQTVQILALNHGNYGGYRKYRKDRYIAPKVQKTAITSYPRCRSGVSILEISVVDQNGMKAGTTKLWISTSTGMKEVWTNSKGEANVDVTGCEIGILSWNKDLKSKHQNINLASLRDTKRRVVIQLDRACNFLIRALGDTVTRRSLDQKSDKIDYVVSTGGRTTSGSFTGGDLSSPICVSVNSGDSLYMVMTVESSDFPNILYMSNIQEGTDAWITVPFPMNSGVIEFEDRKLFSIFNLWESSEDSGISSTRHLDRRAYILNKLDGSTILSFTTSAPLDDFDKNKVYLIFADLFGRVILLKGNVVLFDDQENLKVFEYPGGEYLDSSRWVLGCTNGGSLHTFKEMNQVVTYDSLPRTDSEVLSYCKMNL